MNGRQCRRQTRGLELGRAGELADLRWRDVDLAAGRIYVGRSKTDAGMRGADLLRIKGILNVADSDGPVAIHGIQHLFHPPAMLPGWSGEDRRSRIVFITRDLERAWLEQSMAEFLG